MRAFGLLAVESPLRPLGAERINFATVETGTLVASESNS